MKSIVLYTQRVEIVESYNEIRDCADQRIAEFVNECGFIPIPVPNSAVIAKEIVSATNPAGIILTGGNSLVKYGGNSPERDETDEVLIKLAIKNQIPLYGFCRGMQSILDYYGSVLVNVANHVAVRHRVHGKETDIEVNSYHNQGCLELSSNEIEVVMKTEDGVIEKIKHKGLPIIGTMWHPERESPFREKDIEMIRELFGGENE